MIEKKSPSGKSLPKCFVGFDVKERPLMFRHMLRNPDLKPCSTQICRIKATFNIAGDVVFSSPDYPIDYVYASILYWQNGAMPIILPNEENVIRATSEDSDWFLIFTDDYNHFDFVFLEGKGEQPWSNNQLGSKLSRLSDLFGKYGDRFPSITPHFGLMSPKKSVRIITKDWPRWALNHQGQFYHFVMPKRKDSLKVTRCDAHGTIKKDGGYIFIHNR